LIQRAIEKAGIPTVGLSTFKDRVERINYPRAATVKFPRGATLGRPNDPAMHRQVLLDTFELLRTAPGPSTWVELDHKWAGGGGS
jgi:D-proline reductase (dithiol) PrdB